MLEQVRPSPGIHLLTLPGIEAAAWLCRVTACWLGSSNPSCIPVCIFGAQLWCFANPPGHDFKAMGGPKNLCAPLYDTGPHLTFWVLNIE